MDAAPARADAGGTREAMGAIAARKTIVSAATNQKEGRVLTATCTRSPAGRLEPEGSPEQGGAAEEERRAREADGLRHGMAGLLGDPVELPDGAQGDDGDEGVEENGRALEEDHQDDRDRDRPGELALHALRPSASASGARPSMTPPYRRSRFWKSRIASKRWRFRKSGQSVGVTQISL